MALAKRLRGSRGGLISAALVVAATQSACGDEYLDANVPWELVSELRPDEPGSTDLFRFGSGDTVVSFASPGGNFRLHYTQAGANAVPSADADTSGVPDFIEQAADIYEDVLAFYRDELGFLAPLSDASLPHNGGDGRFDVYFIDFAGSADGAFRQDDCDGDQCIGYMVQENDFASYGYSSRLEGTRVLASHEFFHAIQAAYDSNQGGILGEGSAVWATEQFDPTLDDFEHLADGYLDRPERSLDTPLPGPVDPFSYGSSVFFQFLSERYERDVIRKLYERVVEDGDEPTWFTQLALMLGQDYGSSFAEAFTDFATWNIYTGARADAAVAYDRGGELSQVKSTTVQAPVSNALRVFYASTQYFVVPAAGRTELVAELVSADEELGSLRLIVAAMAGNTVLQQAVVEGGARATLTMGDASVVMIGVANTTTSGNSAKPTLCVGTAKEVAACRKAVVGDEGGGGDDGGGGCSATGPAQELAAFAVLLGLVTLRRRGP